jgi:hypothetical protein
MGWQNRFRATYRSCYCYRCQSLLVRLPAPLVLVTNFDQPTRKGMAVEGPKKGRSIRVNSMWLLQHLLEQRFVALNIVRRTIRRRRFGALARDPALQRMGVGPLLAAG